MFWTAFCIMHSKHDYLAKLKCSKDFQKQVFGLSEHISKELLMQLNSIFNFKHAYVTSVNISETDVYSVRENIFLINETCH